MRPAVTHFALPVLFIVILLFLLAAYISRHSSFYRQLLDLEETSERYQSLDGLRGYLALGVVFCHIAVNYPYWQTGVWGYTPSRVINACGAESVGFFFMITAFLFWSRVVQKDGVLDSFKFYVSRLRRLTPMYLVAATLTILSALTLTDFHLQVALSDLVSQVVAWSLFTLPGEPDINGFHGTRLINTVFWSLVYEWQFYLLLPFLAFFVRTKSQWMLALIAGLCIRFYSDLHVEWYFISGCIAALLVRQEAVRRLANSWVGTILAIACIVGSVLLVPHDLSSVLAVVLFIPFITVASGNSLLGLLTSRPSRLLGMVSYSVYLLHNFILFWMSRLVNQRVAVGTMPWGWYWALGATVAILTVVASSITYRFVEYPYLQPLHRAPAASAV